MKSRSSRHARVRLGKVSRLTDELDALIQAGKDSSHRRLTNRVLKQIWQRALDINSAFLIIWATGLFRA